MIDKIEALLKTRMSVLTADEIRLIWKIADMKSFRSLLYYYQKKGTLRRLQRGVYTLYKEYDKFELAQKLFAPSYISFLSAAQYHGISFQYSEVTTCAALNRKELIIEGRGYSYRRLKESVLFNCQGIAKTEAYSIADPERTICDTIYLFGDTYFDNLNGISTEKLRKYMKMYDNVSFEKRILELCNIIDDVSRN